MLRRWLASLRGTRSEGAAASAVPEGADLARDLVESDVDAARWVHDRLARRAFYTSIASTELERLRRTRASDVAGALRIAERILRHEFDLLGSGPFVPVDPDRPGLPARSGTARSTGISIRSAGCDFRGASRTRSGSCTRCGPAPPTSSTRGSSRAASTGLPSARHSSCRATIGSPARSPTSCDDFVEANPVGIGINWTCTMDVALRAVSWAHRPRAGARLPRRSPASAGERAYSALFDHGVFIRGNLENTYEVTSNHFLSNVVGLWFLGAVFADLPHGAEWTAFARDVARAGNRRPGAAGRRRLRIVGSVPSARRRTVSGIGAPRRLPQHAALGALPDRACAAWWSTWPPCTRPDGLMPQVGDADDGRLHVFAGTDRPRRRMGGTCSPPPAAMFARTGMVGACGRRL